MGTSLMSEHIQFACDDFLYMQPPHQRIALLVHRRWTFMLVVVSLGVAERWSHLGHIITNRHTDIF